MKRFLNKTWIFAVAIAVVAASAVFLYSGIRAAQEAGRGAVTQVETPVRSLPPSFQMMQDENAFFSPDYLLTFDESVSEMPSAKDLTVEEAADQAANVLIQIFSAELDGEVCNALFTSAESVGFGGGEWLIWFGTAGKKRDGYYVLLGSLDGSLRGFGRSVERPFDETHRAQVFNREQYEAYRYECAGQARALMEAWFAGDQAIARVEPFGDWELFAGDAETVEGIGVMIDIWLTDGTMMEFYFDPDAGGLMSGYLMESSGLQSASAGEAAYAEENQASAVEG